MNGWLDTASHDTLELNKMITKACLLAASKVKGIACKREHVGEWLWRIVRGRCVLCGPGSAGVLGVGEGVALPAAGEVEREVGGARLSCVGRCAFCTGSPWPFISPGKHTRFIASICSLFSPIRLFAWLPSLGGESLKLKWQCCRAKRYRSHSAWSIVAVDDIERWFDQVSEVYCYCYIYLPVAWCLLIGSPSLPVLFDLARICIFSFSVKLHYAINCYKYFSELATLPSASGSSDSLYAKDGQ